MEPKKTRESGCERRSNKEMFETKKSRREKGGKKPRKALEPKREETGHERSLDDAFVPSFNVILSFWQGSLLYPKIEFFIKGDMRGLSFFSGGHL